MHMRLRSAHYAVSFLKRWNIQVTSCHELPARQQAIPKVPTRSCMLLRNV